MVVCLVDAQCKRCTTIREWLQPNSLRTSKKKYMIFFFLSLLLSGEWVNDGVWQRHRRILTRDRNASKLVKSFSKDQFAVALRRTLNQLKQRSVYMFRGLHCACVVFGFCYGLLPDAMECWKESCVLLTICTICMCMCVCWFIMYMNLWHMALFMHFWMQQETAMFNG